MTFQEQHVSTSNGSQISTSNVSQISTSNVSQISTSIKPVVSTSNEPNANIEPQAPEQSAAGSSAEDTLKVYEGLIEQMKTQNETLIEANKSLQSQIGLLIRGGGSVGQHTADPEPQNPTQEPGYTSFADLGKELGKRDYYSHNVKDGG